MLTELQVDTIHAVVNVFETSTVRGDYGKVTLIPGDTGQLTFGRSQTTLTSGGLHALVEAYCARPEAALRTDLMPFLGPLDSAAPSLNHDAFFKNLLRCSADDPAMRETQDRFFDARYWEPALARATDEGIEEPLGVAVVYDSTVHGSWPHIRDRTRDAVGAAAASGERTWIREYVRQRHDWLANHRRGDLRRTVYRMEAFQALLDHGAWTLELPLLVRGVEISAASLAAPPPNVYDGPAVRSRDIALTTPLTRGLDVRRVQLALSAPGNDLEVGADGVFGSMTRAAVVAYQERQGLEADGVVAATTFDRLAL